MKKVTSTIFIILSVFTSTIFAETRPLVEDKDYELMSPKASSKPEVLEFFNYACPHCYQMEGFINQFKTDNPDIKFQPVAVELNPQWAIYVKAYYLGELLNIIEKSHKAVFHRIHIEKKYIKNEADLKTLFLGLGVDGAKFDKALNSFALDAKIRKGKQLARKFRILGTPNFVVNRKYKLNNQELGSMDMIGNAMKELANKP